MPRPMMTFGIEWSDLESEKRDYMLELVYGHLLKAAEAEGKQLLEKSWHKPKPKTWQEAWIRMMAIDWQWWSAYEMGRGERPEDSEWEDMVTTYLNDLAEKRCFQALHHLEVEVEV